MTSRRAFIIRLDEDEVMTSLYTPFVPIARKRAKSSKLNLIRCAPPSEILEGVVEDHACLDELDELDYISPFVPSLTIELQPTPVADDHSSIGCSFHGPTAACDDYLQRLRRRRVQIAVRKARRSKTLAKMTL